MDSAEKTDLDKLLDEDSDKEKPVSVNEIPSNVQKIIEQSAEEQKSDTIQKSEQLEDDKQTVEELKQKPRGRPKKRKVQELD